MSKLLLSLSLISSLAFAGKGLLNFSADEPEFLTVDKAFIFNFLQTPQGLKLSWQVTPEHYIYKDKISFQVDGLTLGQVNYPEAKIYQDDYFGEVEIYEHSFSLALPLTKVNADNRFTVTYQGCAKAGLCYPPRTQSLLIDPQLLGAELEPAANVSSKALLSNGPQPMTTSPADGPEAETISLLDKVTDIHYLSQSLESESLPVVLVLFFVVGLGLAFTPCVYPMFPILSRIIVGQKEHLSTQHAFRLSFFYVQGLAITYMLLGILVAFVGAGINATLQQPVVLVPVAIMFVLLSLSMFGFYNLNIPASWQQKLNSISDKQQGGSMGGVFIMGAISGLVCSPCATAPLLAVIAYIAQSQDLLLGGTILYVLALGMGLPLLVIGTGGARLLPRAGAWMDLIKAIFGFALLSVAIVFIERLISPTISSLLWAALAIAVVAYFYHQNQLSRPGAWQTVRTITLLLALFFSAMFVYNTLYSQATLSKQAEQSSSHFIPISSVAELEAQLSLAERQGKRVMLDYYADWCVSCQEFEDKTFSAPVVQAKFSDMLLLQADVTKASAVNSALQKKFKVFGLPTIIFIEQQQELKNSRVTGFMNAERFLRHLNTI